MPDAVPVSSLTIEVSRRIDQTLEANVGRLAFKLVQIMRAEFEKAFKVNDSGGAANTLTFEIERTSKVITLLIGPSKANSYLQNLEYGERGTEGGSGLFQRTKAPPVRNIYDWIKRARLPIPKYFIDKSEAISERVKNGSHIDTKKPWYSIDPLEQYAFAVAMGIKKHGRPALHVIERVLTEQLSLIESIITQST